MNINTDIMPQNEEELRSLGSIMAEHFVDQLASKEQAETDGIPPIPKELFLRSPFPCYTGKDVTVAIAWAVRETFWMLFPNVYTREESERGFEELSPEQIKERVEAYRTRIQKERNDTSK